MNSLKISDFLSGKNVVRYYELYNKTQWYSKAEMEQFQLAKLQRLVNHCYRNIPFYQEYMSWNKIHPQDIKSLEQISLFPIITKEIIKDNYSEFIPANLKHIKGVKTSQTGGTTGNVLFKRNDSETRSSVWATYKRFNDWMGLDSNDRTMILMGGHVIGNNLKDRVKKQFNNILKNSVSFNLYDTSEKNILEIIKSLERTKFSCIRSYSQFLFSLSKRLKTAGLFFDIKAVTTTAELLLQDHRRLYKEVFHAEAFDQYGCGEIGGIAYECDHHNGLHIAEERVIVEVNERQELIVTDLDNLAMPFIRYWNADQAIMSNESCSCGRESRLIKEIMGRTCDYIIGINNEFLHWAYFWHLFFDSQLAERRNLKKFQIVQESKNELLVRIVADPFSPDEEKLLTTNIQERLGLINVRYSFEKNIEDSPAGKYRPVVNRLLN
jgi:phenylacetate-CoA ligase